MLSTREIIRGLGEQHFIEIRLVIQGSNYRKELIPILDKYRSGEYTELEVCEDSNFTQNEFRLFEKRLHNLLVDFYKIPPKLEVDTVLSQSFHVLYSKKHDSLKDRSDELEGIFNKMQALQIGEEGLEVLAELLHLKKDTELFVVYHHLYNHYLNRNFSNRRAIVLINQFFQRASQASKIAGTATEIRQLIFIYKQIRLLTTEGANPLLRVALRITQLTLCVLFDQNQLLFQEKITVQRLLINIRNDIKMMPGSFEKYYFNNIYLLLKLQWSKKNNDLALFNEIREKVLQDTRMLDANNFNFQVNEKELQMIKKISSYTPVQHLKTIAFPVSSRYKLMANFNLESGAKGTLYN